MFNVKVEKQGKGLYSSLAWVMSDNLYMQWNSYSRAGQDWANNVVSLNKDKPNGETSTVAEVNLSSERLYTDNKVVHEGFINLVLNDPEGRHSIVKQIFRGFRK